MDTKLSIILLEMITDYTMIPGTEYDAKAFINKHKAKIYDLFDQELKDAVYSKLGPKKSK